MKVAKPLFSLLSSNPRLLALAKRVCAWAKPENFEDCSIGEITPFSLSSSSNKTARLNLVVPGISEQHVFGGIATALKFFERASGEFEDVRIIVSDEQMAVIPAGKFYSEWPLVLLGENDAAGRCITVAGDRYGKELSIRENDVFMATAWWTAHAVRNILAWQELTFGKAKRPFTYIIQDFEPGFYPWSARYALALDTYQYPDDTIAVINTGLLHKFLQNQGFHFSNEFVFEPQINQGLRSQARALKASSKKRKLFVYGRPSVDRNAFPLVVSALRDWAHAFSKADQWEVYSLGESHGEIQLGADVTLKSLGKVSIDEYAKHLEETAVGLSLMISPHPSYPPLELASFGAGVVTNRYANKDLSILHNNIFCPERLHPACIASTLVKACEAFEKSPQIFVESRPDDFSFTHEFELFDFAPKVAKILKKSLENDAHS